VSKSAKNDNRRTPANDNRPSAAAKVAAAPRIEGIDYRRAIDAISDLTTWALDLADADVADWPEGRRRVRNARRFVLARLRGKNPRSVQFEDVIFTAGLLARIFEAELGFSMSQIVGALDEIGLPTEVVPLRPRVQPSTHVVIRPAVVPPRERLPTPTACPGCAHCGHGSRYRNAA